MARIKPVPFSREALVSLLTQYDLKESARDMRYGGRVNIYRIGILLNAVDSLMDEIALHEISPAVAFTRHFCPTREMHGIAKRLSLALDVQRGHWVVL